MSKLTGFQTVTSTERSEFDGKTSIRMSNSPFQHGVTFTISGYDYKKPEVDGRVQEDAPTCPVLTTSVGDLFLSTVLRPKVNKDGAILEPNGSFNRVVREIILQKTTNGEILTAIVAASKDKKVRVTRVPYVGLSKDGRQFPAAIVQLDFVEA